MRRARSPLLLPGVLLAAALLAHLVFALSGLSLADARALGWTFEAPHAVGLAPTWDMTDVRNFPWHLIPSLSADIFAVMFVTAITMLLNTTGIELVTRREANLQRELTTLGAANLVAAGLGGYVSCISLSQEAGARLVLVNLSNEFSNAFRARGFITDDVTVATDLDRALETCEEEVIAVHSVSGVAMPARCAIG